MALINRPSPRRSRPEFRRAGASGCALALALCIGVALTPGRIPANESAIAELVEYKPFARVAPQDITFDEVNGTYWATSLLFGTIFEYDLELDSVVSEIPTPFEGFQLNTGIAWNPFADTLFVMMYTSPEIVEIDKTGARLREFEVPLLPGQDPRPPQVFRSMRLDPYGDDGRGSLYVVENLGSAIIEVSLQGELIRVLSHPEDDDGWEGRDSSAIAGGIELIHDGDDLEYIVLTGLRSPFPQLIYLDAEGEDTGLRVDAADAGGNISSVLRRPIDASGETAEVGEGELLIVVESNARLAVLRDCFPEFREIDNLECSVEDREILLTWERHQDYDGIEILEGCDVVDVLPGTADSWRRRVERDGIRELSVRAFASGGERTLGPCTLVIGAGSLLASVEVGGELPIDMTSDEEFIVVSDPRSRGLHVFDHDLQLLSRFELMEGFLGEDELLTAIAPSDERDVYLIYNSSAHRVGRVDLTGDVFASFDARLPNLEEDPEAEPDRGFVVGMAFDPGDGETGDGASLWLSEVREDVLHQIDLEGNLLRSIRHPFFDLEAPFVEETAQVSSGCIAWVQGSRERGPEGELWLAGSSVNENRMERIVRWDIATGRIVPGSEITTRALQELPVSGAIALTESEVGGESRLWAMTLGRAEARICRLEQRPFEAPTPAFLTCAQRTSDPHVTFAFRNNGPYDRIEVFRDCEPHLVLPGDAVTGIDRDVPLGDHQYAIRGVRDDVVSDFVECEIRVGLGAVLQRAPAWPARSPNQMTRDPIDGDFWLVVDWPGFTNVLYRFDRNLRFLDERPSTVPEDDKIWSLTVRIDPDGQRQLWMIAAPPPAGLAREDQGDFTLYSETLDGEPLGSRPIVPPLPENGFITFPAALTWHAPTDRFIYLERNSRTFLWLDSDGEELATFEHPDPPFQNFVYNLGLSFDPQRDTLWISGSQRRDYRITRLIELDLEGAPTGREFDVSHLENNVRDFEFADNELVIAGTSSEWEWLRVLFRGPVDEDERFLRGDTDRDGRILLTDALRILDHLFRQAPRLACEDAADADDDGRLTLTDPILILEHLFQGRATLPEPFEIPGLDPTLDDLECR